MEEQSYIERRNQIKRARRSVPRKKEGYFVLKLNMALAIGIMVLCANMIDLDITNAFTDKVEKAVTQSVDLGELKKTVSAAVSSFVSGESLSPAAKEKHPITMDEELIKQMNEQAEAYENAQKKTQP